MFTILRDLIKGNPKRKPGRPITIDRIDTLPVQVDDQTKAIWFGIN